MASRFRTVLGLFAILLAGCGGGKGSTPSEPPGDVIITVSPSAVVLAPGGTQQFTAAVAGASSPALT